jgi:hypothetical protein
MGKHGEAKTGDKRYSLRDVREWDKRNESDCSMRANGAFEFAIVVCARQVEKDA